MNMNIFSLAILCLTIGFSTILCTQPSGNNDNNVEITPGNENLANQDEVASIENDSSLLVNNLGRIGISRTENGTRQLLSSSANNSLERIFSGTRLDGTIYIEDEAGNVIYDYNSTKYFAPASTLKVLTSACSLFYLGDDFHFETKFYTDSDNNLYMKGFGDPYLISEEFPALVNQLRQSGIETVNNIYGDPSFFADNIEVPGRDENNRPYSAHVSGLDVNFNTINVVIEPDGTILSAEEQTPLTDFARQIARNRTRRTGTTRINITDNKDNAPLYACSLLKHFMIQAGIAVNGEIGIKKLPDDAEFITSYKNSRNLTEVIRGLLMYSNNLMANQIMLTIGAVKYGEPATLEKGVLAVQEFLENELGIHNIIIEEGSGLCHNTRIRAFDMVRILDYLAGYIDLFIEKDRPVIPGIFLSKSGGLEISASEVGYIQSSRYGLIKFVIMINDLCNKDPEPYNYGANLLPLKERTMEIIMRELG